MVEVPSTEHIDFSEVGYSWSFKKEGVGTYDSGVVNQFNKNWNRKDSKDITLTAIAKTKDINWRGTLIANAIYGEDQSECEMSKGAELIITHIESEELVDKIKATV